MIGNLVSWGLRLDHWTRKPLLFVIYPLAVLECTVGALIEQPSRLITAAYWDFTARMWWVAWDGALINRHNRSTWPWQA